MTVSMSVASADRRLRHVGGPRHVASAAAAHQPARPWASNHAGGLTRSSSGAVDVAGEQRGTSDQHERLSGVDVVTLGLQTLRGSLGEDQRLARDSPAARSASARSGNTDGTADTDRRVDLLGLVEATEGLDEITAPCGQPRQVVAQVGGPLRPALRLVEVECPPRVGLGSVDLAGPSEQHATIGRSSAMSGRRSRRPTSSAASNARSASGCRPARCSSRPVGSWRATLSSPSRRVTARVASSNDRSNSPGVGQAGGERHRRQTFQLGIVERDRRVE